MKVCLAVFAGIVLIIVSGCGGNGSTGIAVAPTPSPAPPPTPSVGDEWTWVGGSNLIDQAGTYGVEGTAAAGDIPPGRYGGVSWTDNSGNFWLFGGIAALTSTTDEAFNDLWEYSAGHWTWTGGSNGFNQAGVYGTEGTPAAGNVPGARFAAASWKDGTGNFWLFGGLGLDARGSSELLGDLWEYSGNQWTWMGGPKIALQNQAGIYGTQSTPTPSNLPGERAYAVSWTDLKGNFWLFGGYGCDSTGALGELNDLWRYSAGQWTWIAGSSLINQASTYGTKGTPATGNSPGARIEASAWTDAAGSLWLFGGSFGQAGQSLALNDLWRYSGGQWTWMSGSNTFNQFGTYGTRGTAAAENTPGGRGASATWSDAAGSLWLFGGDGFDSAGNRDYLNDLWRYSGGQWTWMGGPNVADHLASYGMQGIASASNIPGGRSNTVTWQDASGNVWLFGGLGTVPSATNGHLNDLWEFQP